MGLTSRLGSRVRRRIITLLTRLLTKPLPGYDQRVPNSLRALKANLRPGDVILVEGDQRVSQVIQYLTRSSWSHSALYLGDELRRFNPTLADALAAQYGDDARHLLIEATVEEGVTCSPVARYVPYNLRVCRPRGLLRPDLDRVIEELVGQIGRQYSVRHIFELGRYFFPISLIPHRFRRAVLHYGGGTRRVICSTMLARAFANVGYPVVPHVTIDQTAEQTTWLGWLVGRNGHSARALYRREDPALITPRDFDLSPYFDIVKFNYLTLEKFDYRRIEWTREETGPLMVAESAPEAGNGANGRRSKDTQQLRARSDSYRVDRE